MKTYIDGEVVMRMSQAEWNLLRDSCLIVVDKLNDVIKYQNVDQARQITRNYRGGAFNDINKMRDLCSSIADGDF